MTDAALRPAPVLGKDTEFFWLGAGRGELLIQRCVACGLLRHVPRPLCPTCRSFDWDTVQAAGTGTVYSYVVHHHPPIPGFELPLVLVLVDLDEGVRMAGALVEIVPEDVRVGLPVEVTFDRIDDQIALPQWRPRAAAAGR